MKKLLTALAAAMLLISAFAAPAYADGPPAWSLDAPAADADADGYSEAVTTAVITSGSTSLSANRAGRPITGDALDWCQGIAYGRVNTRLVLFTAAHCYMAPGGGYNILPGTKVKDVNTGDVIGTIGAVPSNVSSHDLGFIYIASGARPANLDDVYIGANNVRDVSKPFPSHLKGCSGMNSTGGYSGAPIRQPFQTSLTSIANESSGTTQGFLSYTSGTQCVVKSNMQQHGSMWYGLKDSGSAFWNTSDLGAPSGVASLTWGSNPAKIAYTPLYEGITNLDAYWNTHGYGVGAWFCFTPTCSSTDKTP